MKPYAKEFYKSPAWKHCRNTYYKKVGGMCENCMMSGIYTPGEIVHHKIHISPVNITNPEISLNHANLELLCRKCHALKHGGKRYRIDPNTGEVVI